MSPVTRYRPQWAGSALLLPSLAFGCAQVDPSPEVAAARQFIDDTTGLGGSWDASARTMDSREIELVLAEGLTLDEAVFLALRNSSRLRAAFGEIGVAKADLIQSTLLSNPSLSLLGLFPSGGGSPSLQASLAQQLSDLWRIPRAEGAAGHALNAVVLKVAWIGAELCQETREAYYGAVAATELLAAAESSRDLAGSSLEAVRAMLEGGAATLLDESLAQGRVLSAEIEVRAARLASADARRRLAMLLALEVDVQGLRLGTGWPVFVEEALDPEALAGRAVEARLDVAAMKAEIQAAREREELERWSVFSDVLVGGALERPEREAGATEQGKTLYGPTLTVSLPVFDQNQAQVARARYLREQAEQTLRALRAEVNQQVRMAVDHLSTAAQAVAFCRERLLPEVERGLLFAQEAFSGGETTILALLEAQRALVGVRMDYVRAQYDLAVALAQLERALGLPLTQIQVEPGGPP